MKRLVGGLADVTCSTGCSKTVGGVTYTGTCTATTTKSVTVCVCSIQAVCVS